MQHERQRLEELLPANSQITCVIPCWPAAVTSLGMAVIILPGVPEVIILVVRIVIGVFMPLLVTPATTKACMPHVNLHPIMPTQDTLSQYQTVVSLHREPIARLHPYFCCVMQPQLS